MYDDSKRAGLSTVSQFVPRIFLNVVDFIHSSLLIPTRNRSTAHFTRSSTLDRTAYSIEFIVVDHLGVISEPSPLAIHAYKSGAFASFVTGYIKLVKVYGVTLLHS